jgi:AraC family transcriptional regulator
LFKQSIGFTPADYIRKRRLSEIARAIDDSARPVSEIAFAYGFNSKENFTRAFKSEHHILPTEYKAAGNSLKLYGDKPLPLTVAEPEIMTLPEFSLTVYASDEEQATNFWNKYNSCGYSKSYQAAILSKILEYVGAIQKPVS